MSVRIRLATPADAAAIADIYRPSVTDTVTSFELVPPSAAGMWSRVEEVLTRTPWLVCETTRGIVGYAYASRHRDRPAYDWSVDVSAYVRADAQRSGVGRALYTSLFAVLVLQGFRNAYAGITLPNDASVGLHTALGFTAIGIYRRVGYKAGAWHDVQWLARELAPHIADPPPPVPLPALPGSPAFDAALAAGVGCVRPDREAPRHGHSADL